MERSELKNKISNNLQALSITGLKKSFIEELSLSIGFYHVDRYDLNELVALLSHHWDLFQQHGYEKHHVTFDDQHKKTHIHIFHQNYPFLVTTVLIILQAAELTPQDVFFGKQSVLITFEQLLDKRVLDDLKDKILNKLLIIQYIQGDYLLMKAKMHELGQLFHHQEEFQSWLNWLEQDGYIFLGYEFLSENITNNNIPTRLGFMQDAGCYKYYHASAHEIDIIKDDHKSLLMIQSGHLSTVHRSVPFDIIVIKQLDEKTKKINIHRFIGLLTAEAYHESVMQIPMLAAKTKEIYKQLELDIDTFEGRKVQHLLAILNRNDLFYQDERALIQLIQGVYAVYERPVVKVFHLDAPHSSAVIFYVYIPRDIFNSALRIKIQKFLMEELDAQSCSFEPVILESPLARIRFELRGVKQAGPYDRFYDKIVELTRPWHDELHDYLAHYFDRADVDALFKTYKTAFPLAYQERYSFEEILSDIKILEQLSPKNSLIPIFYTQPERRGALCLKLFQEGSLLALSEIIPILERFGLKILRNRMFELRLEGRLCWINEFETEPYAHDENTNMLESAQELQSAFIAIIQARLENDGFNQLIIGAGLSARQATLLRAWSKYLWQTGFAYSQDYVEQLCAAQPKICYQLVRYFEIKFDPNLTVDDRTLKLNAYVYTLDSLLEALQHLDTDRILRKFYNLIQAMVRTNYFQKSANDSAKEWVSFKINPSLISEMPRPLMYREIYVYSPSMEGVHLRSSPIARGGIRWSDRFDDYRTEILGLVKAQQVKNTIIVPAGAKGGFIIRNQAAITSKDAVAQAALEAYQSLIRGMLDLTDNRVDGVIVTPPQTVIYDDTDPYLVVAADKGTATYSDTANSLSAEYKFWLGDAFASGGSQGYDHKKIGITARGAFESVKNHCADLGLNLSTDAITAIGIGDMSGDVFGNGALLAPQMRLLAAFNHLDIFIDPNPDVERSYQERMRLFKIGKGSWSDYDTACISAGGGVFSRKLKSITLSPQIKDLLGTEKEKMSPNELIKHLLQVPVTMIFNGGIGTYVKASTERHSDVRDKQNDPLRVDATELKAKMFIEGGNLGVTQRARIEFSQLGGVINTDTLDNSGGVDCSDHEVNIKILIDSLIQKGIFDHQRRPTLLAEMTDSIAQLVLANNQAQNKAISMMHHVAFRDLKLHSQVMLELEQKGLLDRELEFLPKDQELDQRLLDKKGLTRPELIVLMSYVKMDLKNELSTEQFDRWPLLKKQLLLEFPSQLNEVLGEHVYSHPLVSQIIATMIGNTVVNQLGVGFVHRLKSELKVSSLVVVQALFIARALIDDKAIRESIIALDHKVHRSLQYNLYLQLSRSLYRLTRWIIKNNLHDRFDDQMMQRYQRAVSFVREQLSSQHDYLKEQYPFVKELLDCNISLKENSALTTMLDLVVAFDVQSIAEHSDHPIDRLYTLYSQLKERLSVKTIEYAIECLPVSSSWDALGRNFLRDDLQSRLMKISLHMLEHDHGVFADWEKRRKGMLTDWDKSCSQLALQPEKDFIKLNVILRQLELFF